MRYDSVDSIDLARIPRSPTPRYTDLDNLETPDYPDLFNYVFDRPWHRQGGRGARVGPESKKEIWLEMDPKPKRGRLAFTKTACRSAAGRRSPRRGDEKGFGAPRTIDRPTSRIRAHPLRVFRPTLAAFTSAHLSASWAMSRALGERRRTTKRRARRAHSPRVRGTSRGRSNKRIKLTKGGWTWSEV